MNTRIKKKIVKRLGFKRYSIIHDLADTLHSMYSVCGVDEIVRTQSTTWVAGKKRKYFNVVFRDGKFFVFPIDTPAVHVHYGASTGNCITDETATSTLV